MDQALLIYIIFIAILICIFIIGAISEQRYINKKNKAIKDLLKIILEYCKAHNESKKTNNKWKYILEIKKQK